MQRSASVAQLGVVSGGPRAALGPPAAAGPASDAAASCTQAPRPTPPPPASPTTTRQHSCLAPEPPANLDSEYHAGYRVPVFFPRGPTAPILRAVGAWGGGQAALLREMLSSNTVVAEHRAVIATVASHLDVLHDCLTDLRGAVTVQTFQACRERMATACGQAYHMAQVLPPRLRSMVYDEVYLDHFRVAQLRELWALAAAMPENRAAAAFLRAYAGATLDERQTMGKCVYHSGGAFDAFAKFLDEPEVQRQLRRLLVLHTARWQRLRSQVLDELDQGTGAAVGALLLRIAEALAQSARLREAVDLAAEARQPILDRQFDMLRSLYSLGVVLGLPVHPGPLQAAVDAAIAGAQAAIESNAELPYELKFEDLTLPADMGDVMSWPGLVAGWLRDAPSSFAEETLSTEILEVVYENWLRSSDLLNEVIQWSIAAVPKNPPLPADLLCRLLSCDAPSEPALRAQYDLLQADIAALKAATTHAPMEPSDRMLSLLARADDLAVQASRLDTLEAALAAAAAAPPNRRAQRRARQRAAVATRAAAAAQQAAAPAEPVPQATLPAAAAPSAPGVAIASPVTVQSPSSAPHLELAAAAEPEILECSMTEEPIEHLLRANCPQQHPFEGATLLEWFERSLVLRDGAPLRCPACESLLPPDAPIVALRDNKTATFTVATLPAAALP